MAILNIVKVGDEVLRKKCRTVDEITPKIQTLLDDMRDTLKKANGVGLAAPQVGVLRRICIVENEDGEVIELINPVIVKESKERQHEIEGCLSVPNQWGITDRPAKVTVEALNRNGKKFRVSGTGITARCFCHEIDHLDGKLFIDDAEMVDPEDLEK